MAYSRRAPKTKKMQQMTQDCMALRPSAFGELVVVVLKMFTWNNVDETPGAKFVMLGTEKYPRMVSQKEIGEAKCLAVGRFGHWDCLF